MPKKQSKKLQAHHAKPYRKRHLSLLAVSLLSASVLCILLVATSLINQRFIKNAKKLVENTFDLTFESTESSKISSNYGFSLDYNPKLLYASALDSSDGKLYTGQELFEARSYSAIKLGQAISDTKTTATSGSLSLEYYYNQPTGSSTDLAKLEAKHIGSQIKSLTKTASTKITISGETFLKTDWSTKTTSGITSGLTSRLTSYIGVVNGAPLSIQVNYGLDQDSTTSGALEAAVQSLQFGAPNKSLAADTLSNKYSDGVDTNSSLSILDRLLFTEQASASAFKLPSSSEKISTLYGSSVVKIYNAYCMDVMLSGQLFVQDACNASTGSGFFIGANGNIATNGHVAVNNPLDIAITFAFDKMSKGDATYLNALADAASLTNNDIASAETQQEKLKIIVNKLYTIPNSVLTTKNKTENILIGLGEKQPDMKSLLTMTEARQPYPSEDLIRLANLVAYNYRAIDGADTGSFNASDVAILKVEGSNYPSTKLGSISSLTQGSELNIIGYPGVASSNQLVESTESRATLTSGKVASIKSAAGSSSQLIETDATIGHGNSGGPAFNDDGEVVGIATYTIDGSGDGNGVFNYIRDIADLTELATKNSVDTQKLSATQLKWQLGIENFYKAKYSSAVKDFSEVKSLYPQHPMVDQLIALSQQKISAGEESKGTPIMILSIGLGVSILATVTAVVLIFRHHKKHRIYLDQQTTSSGNSSPISPQPQQTGQATTVQDPSSLDNNSN